MTSDARHETLHVAKCLIDMLPLGKEKEMLPSLAKRIKQLYNNMCFSPRLFAQFLTEHVEKSILGRLFELYYILSVLLRDTLAIRLHLILQMMDSDTLNAALYELFAYREDIGKAYVMSLSNEQSDEFFMKDSKYFLNNDTVRLERIKRLYYVLQRPDTNRKSCIGRLLLMVFYETIERAKKDILCHSNHGNHEKDFIFQYLASWFFEFNQDSTMTMTEFTIEVLQLASEAESDIVPDIGILLFIYSSGCRQLVAEGRDMLRIFDIMDWITKGTIDILEKGDSTGSLAVLLAFAQITLHFIHTDLSYSTWFENTFSNLKTTTLTKRGHGVLLKTLEDMIPYEIPSVLQIHGKALLNHTHDTLFIRLIRKRLLELGVDNSLKKYPSVFNQPLQTSSSTASNAVEDQVTLAVESFVKKNGVIPTTVLQNFVFRRQWFIATFLPSLFSWNTNDSTLMSAKHQLILALKEKGKIPESIYNEYINK
ncbi:uncharacterized protein RHIMIDRAFT_248072 [Rhizopus microsporus ATCC 52813]|uniref:Uncharacterized protein n=1 Tax=Rhizopus microsporus ATCC 52813 TaxID=1340429 RepID=A0A2G4SH21_RHIZD|nr:uncharacterized protein RHIMIDRAFT_248072 [Rhizopus microsporus ATCC 52813]PHZ08052.1 hypothetical protein RHIMIDRAFT_248072 [Rhizopus microsporus ATCC 52813]